MKTSSNNAIDKLSKDPKVNQLLGDIVKRLKDYAEDQTNRFNELTKIGVALSATRNLDQLLEMIVDQARMFTNCDGGTLYLMSEDDKFLHFTIVQTDSLGFRMGGLSGSEVTLPPVPLYKDGEPNGGNVSAHVALTGELVNIADVYEVEGFNFEGTRKFDQFNNYRSQSMLVIPMKDHDGDIIGVLQLINAKDKRSGETVPFAYEFQMLTEALASQAAVAITNAKLIRDQQNLFDSFIKTIAAAIDAKSPYTGGHIERVSLLTMDIAHKVHDAKEGYYADVSFSEDEFGELRLAAWLHDTGKITTPESVVDKKTKLESIFDREELVRTRFELSVANMKLKAYENQALPVEVDAEINQAMQDLEFVLSNNKTSEFVPDEKINRLQEIAARTVRTSQGDIPLLTENELYNLCIRKGNLTFEERKIIENHAQMTIELLERLPFPKRMKHVPFYAGAHHEKLNGKGYPKGLTADEIPLQARIMALADVFEALTARDRPYKDPKKMTEVMKILGFMVKDNELDADLVKFFFDNKMHIEYAHKYLSPEQIDVE